MSSLSMLPLSYKHHTGVQGQPPAGGDKLEQISMQLVSIQNAVAASFCICAALMYFQMSALQISIAEVSSDSVLKHTVAQSTKLQASASILLTLQFSPNHGCFYPCLLMLGPAGNPTPNLCLYTEQ